MRVEGDSCSLVTNNSTTFSFLCNNRCDIVILFETRVMDFQDIIKILNITSSQNKLVSSTVY